MVFFSSKRASVIREKRLRVLSLQRGILLEMRVRWNWGLKVTFPFCCSRGDKKVRRTEKRWKEGEKSWEEQRSREKQREELRKIEKRVAKSVEERWEEVGKSQQELRLEGEKRWEEVWEVEKSSEDIEERIRVERWEELRRALRRVDKSWEELRRTGKIRGTTATPIRKTFPAILYEHIFRVETSAARLVRACIEVEILWILVRKAPCMEILPVPWKGPCVEILQVSSKGPCIYIYIQILWVLLCRPCKDLANFKGSLYRELVNSECPCLEILWVLLKSPCKEILQFDWKGLCKEILRGPGNVLVSMWRSCEFFWKGFLQRDLASSLNRSFQIDLVFFFERALAKRSCKFLEQVLVNRSCECSWSLSRDLASSLQVSLYTDLVSSSKGPCIDVEILWTLLRRVLAKRSCKFLERALPRKSCVFLLMVLAKRSCYLIERVLVGRFELLSKTAV
jgi:hypothetical protein